MTLEPSVDLSGLSAGQIFSLEASGEITENQAAAELISRN